MTATILPNAKNQFFYGDGNPLVGGSVYFYIPNTNTLKTTWQDAAEQIQNTNPIILDGSGEAIIYGSGEYRQVVYDIDGNLIWDALTADITSTLQAAGIVYCGTSTGTANAQVLSPSPTIVSLSIGQLLAFTAGFTNTAAMTIQVSAMSPVQIYYGGVAAGQDSVQAGGYTLIEWDGTHFQLANQVTPSYPANTFVANATNSTNFPTGVVLANSQLAGRGASGNIAAISIDDTLNITGTTLGVVKAPGAFNKETIYAAAGTYTWTADAATNSIEVFVWSAGSGGGPSAGAGGLSSFGSITATGASATGAGPIPGIPGVGSGGSINAQGGVGGSTNSSAFGGTGGSGAMGGGGGGLAAGNAGTVGGFPGGGGGYGGLSNYCGSGGGYSYKRLTSVPVSQSTVVGAGGIAGTNGGAGADGMVIIREYF